MIRILQVLLFIFVFTTVDAQQLGGIFTRFEDDLSEWIIMDEAGNEAGSLKMRWAIQGDITYWDYTFGEHSGEIRARWRDNFSEWEVHGDGFIITMRQIWRDIATEWRLTDDEDHTFTFVTRWANTPEEWELREKQQFGRFEVFTAWEGDPRDWVIIDELHPNVPVPMRMGMTFLPILLMIPK
jgi:hypothetical protein